MKKDAIIGTAMLLLSTLPALAQVKETEPLDSCQEVLNELMGIPEGIPQNLLDKAECVAVIPSVKKFALTVGARFGKGAVVCRTDGGHGAWGPPLMISIGGGSFGAQIGGQAADYIFLIMRRSTVPSVLSIAGVRSR